MGSVTDERKIPVIYFTKENLIPGTASWGLTCNEVRSALEQCGCFEVVFEKSSVEIHNSVFEATKSLFALPTETLSQPTTNRPGLAYTPNWNYNPLFETLGIDYPSSPHRVEDFTNIMWPLGNEDFGESVLSFSRVITEIYELTTRMIFESYGVERLHKSIMAATFPRLKLAKYRAPKENEAKLGLRTHTDKTFITIVHQHEVEGLEIKTKDGEWSDDAKPSSSSFVVFAGDAFMAWSNDRVKPSEHRVVMKKIGKDRYVISLFTYMEGVLDIPEELVDERYPLQYKPFNHMNFMKRFFVEEDPALQYSPCAIKTFCGV